MTKGEKKSNTKKRDLVKEVNMESEEKWRGLENKVWTVAEFGFYVVLFTFTVFAIGYRSSALINGKNGYIDDQGAKYIEAGNETVYYNVANQCSDLDNCSISYEASYQNSNVDIKYNMEDGTGSLKVNKITIDTNPVTEFALLKNGYVATFITRDDTNKISYYDNEGKLVREYRTILKSNGKLDSEVGIYAVCNNRKTEIVKYTIQSDGNFFEELIGSYYSDQC